MRVFPHCGQSGDPPAWAHAAHLALSLHRRRARGRLPRRGHPHDRRPHRRHPGWHRYGPATGYCRGNRTRHIPSCRARGDPVSTVTLPDTPPRREAHGQWAVETHGLTKRFGDNVAVNGVELLVPRGCAFGYLGPNGAGKTTLIRVLLGLTHADAGTMSLLGYPVPKQRAAALARVGAIVDEPRFHGHLTGTAEPAAAGRGTRAGGAGPYRAVARARGHPASRRRPGVEVLDGHAPAPRRGSVPDRGPPATDPRRAHERARPRRHARDARHDPVVGGRGPHGRAVVAPPRRGRADLRCRGHRGPGQHHPPGADLRVVGGRVAGRADRMLRARASSCPAPSHHHRGRHRRRRRRDWESPGRPARGATSSPRSTACSSKGGSRCTGSRRSKPRSRRGSCRSRADWGPRNDDDVRRGRAGPDHRAPGFEARPPRVMGPHRRHDHHPVHGAAQTARAHGRPHAS